MADVVAELEAAFTDAGTLLVWAEKYRHPDPSVLPALRRRALALGDRARELARAGALEERAARELLETVSGTNRSARQLIDACRAAAIYREAVEARAAGDAERTLALLPLVFADLRVGPAPAAAFWAPAWQRRGRPRPAEEVAEELCRLAAEGIPATTEDLTPGVDPELPGVLLQAGLPFGAPLALRFDRTVLPDPCLRLGDEQLLLPGEHLRLPFTVTLAAPDEPLDEWVADPPAYLSALARACRDRRLPFDR
jgi:hypothetical protein